MGEQVAGNAGEVIRVSIGSEPLQYVPMLVLMSSILRRTSRPVEFTASWTEAAGWHPLMAAAPRLRGTKFSLWRWLVPQVYENKGLAIYLDSDQVVLADIGELWDAMGDAVSVSIAAVINAVGVFGKNKTPELDHVQTSVMTMDCERCSWDAESLFRQVEAGTLAYRDLMQAAWLRRWQIKELPPEWNHFGIHTPQTKLLHWSHVASQPYRCPDHPTAHIFRAELQSAIEAGHVSRDVVRSEVKQGHLHRSYYK